MHQPITPRVFVSAVSSDLKTARKIVNEALTQIECLPVEETIFGTEYGEIREMIERKIDSCQAVVHLVGRDYGGEPDLCTLPADQPRRSWTQLEYDIARDKNRKLYLLVCDDTFPFDPAAQLNDAEKLDLQRAHRHAVLADRNLWHNVKTANELRQAVERMKISLDEVRAELKSVGEAVTRVVGDALQRLSDPEALAESIRQQIKSAADGKIAALPNVAGRWQKVAEIERECDLVLGRVNEMLTLIQEGLVEGASPIFEHGSEILEKEGIEAAVSYLELRRLNSLETARRHAKQAEMAQARVTAEEEQRNRALRPLLLEADLRETRLDWPGALQLREQVAELAPNWFETRSSLGQSYFNLANFREAEPHMRAAVTVATNAAQEATALNNLAWLLKATNRLAEAELLFRRALAIDEQNLGRHHPHVARDLINLALLLKRTNRMGEAEPLMRRALAIDEQYFGNDHPEVATDLSDLTLLLNATNRMDEAEPLIRRALAIDEQSFGREHPKVAIRLNNLAWLLQSTKRLSEAEPLIRRALAINIECFGDHHPKVGVCLNTLGVLLQAANRMAEAEPLMRRALAIDEQYYGAEHPRIAAKINNLATLLQETNRLEEAESLMRRALAIDEQTYGADHPDVARDLGNFSGMLKSTNRLTEAESLMRRCLSILRDFRFKTGYENPRWRKYSESYCQLLELMKFTREEIEVKLREVTEE